MKCYEATEHVSALCDGMTIPRDAAEHINGCESCRKRLKEYIAMGAELRRLASVEIAEAPIPQFDTTRRSFAATLWQRARKNMRIPRLAFASLLAAVVVLGSGWARESVQNHKSGSVLLVQFSTGPGPVSFCALSTVHKRMDSCAGGRIVKSGVLLWEIQAQSKDGDKAVLGVRAAVVPRGPFSNTGYVNKLPQRRYELKPGSTLHVEVRNLGTMSFTGQWISYIPAVSAGDMNQFREYLEPRAGELRFYSPLLLHGNQIIGQMEGGFTSVDQPGRAVEVYLKGVGRFDLSLYPMPGAVRGKVGFNRISFTIHGHSYTFVTAAPVSRSRYVWVSRSPGPRLSVSNSYLGTTEISKLIPATARP